MMDASCYLHVDVNGEEVFMVNKKILSSYLGRINKLFVKSKGASRNLKVVFHDFPGGAEGFELITRLCYNNGTIDITPFNVSLLRCMAHYMEMNKSIPGCLNLFEETEKSLKDIRYWTWSELLVALKQCQDLLPLSCSSGVLDKCLDSLVGRLALTSETSPCPSTCSADSSVFRLSCDTRSSESLKNTSYRATWWFEDLLAFNPQFVEMLMKWMLLRKFDHVVISRFLFYYQRSRFVEATSDEKREIMETVVELLHCLEQNSLSLKSLFGILRVSLSLNISKHNRSKLEFMIGSQLDQATLDNLLFPSPTGSNYLYDINLVLRFLRSFLGREACSIPLTPLKKVASLIDLYTAEVAPDPCLRPSKFLALLMALPDSSRDSFDGVYHSIDLYLEVHARLSEEEKMRVCCGLNYEKLSAEACSHLALNTKFPLNTSVQALTSQKCKLKNLLQDTNKTKSPKGNKESCDQIVLYAGKLDIVDDNEKLKAHLQGMQWRVLELEKVCRKMQTQMEKILKSRLSSHRNARSLPRLCS